MDILPFLGFMGMYYNRVYQSASQVAKYGAIGNRRQRQLLFLGWATGAILSQAAVSIGTRTDDERIFMTLLVVASFLFSLCIVYWIMLQLRRAANRRENKE
jgi:hypothetical protein